MSICFKIQINEFCTLTHIIDTVLFIFFSKHKYLSEFKIKVILKSHISNLDLRLNWI